ncbi:TIGR00341 family protein [Demequina sp.]|uniref:TIGR00341 family protein n=1 Tax=Demequina sp. TaxID=2050685 RepID=UPI003D114453
MTDASAPRTTKWGAALNSVDYMREAVFFDGPSKRAQYTRFWLLLTLASAIAAAGVVANSTATVIGAMIVAPLMRPIQGTMLAAVLGDRANLRRSILTMIAGACGSIAVGVIVGLLVVQSITAQTNDQVASRVSPGLIDLFAALATGVVGSIALLRSDISDTLPGVAIAISLVPPLCVVGLTLESGEPGQAFGALLLFLTNVAAILGSGAVVMAIYGFSRVRIEEAEDKEAARKQRATAYVTMAALVAIIAVPLAYSTVHAIQTRSALGRITTYVEEATAGTAWDLVSISQQENDTFHVIVKGEPPIPDIGVVYDRLSESGLDPSKVTVEFVPAYSFDSTHTAVPDAVAH